ncbi:MAG: hypothetical protein ACFFCS_08425 [Candidatus Hodarchaeota archaeon]
MSSKEEVKFKFVLEYPSWSMAHLQALLGLLMIGTWVILLWVGGFFDETGRNIMFFVNSAVVLLFLIPWQRLKRKFQDKEIIIDKEKMELRRIRENIFKDKKNIRIESMQIENIKGFRKKGENANKYQIWIDFVEEGKPYNLLSTKQQEGMDKVFKWLEVHLKPLLEDKKKRGEGE